MSMFDHDYVTYPELTNTELEVLGFTSPHPQLTEDFYATVVKVHDGDTLTLQTAERDFDFPLRLLEINAPELNEQGGKESGDWLRGELEGEEVKIEITPKNRVDKYGRLLGSVIHRGLNMGEVSIALGKATPYDARNEGKIPVYEKLMKEAAI